MSKSRENLFSPYSNQEKIIPPKLTLSDAVESNDDSTADNVLEMKRSRPERSFTGTFDGTFEFDKSAFRQENVLSPGTTIGGTYVIKKLLGAGGMGQVYLARHKGLDRDVALKVLATNHITEKAWWRFEAEAKTVAGLDHPSLVRVTDLGVHEGKFPYYAMDYVDGESLESVIRKLGPMVWQRALPLFKQVADGLAFAHAKGIVHRDLKPANILVVGAESGSPQIKILDFGLAKLSQMDPENMRLTSTGEIFGSPYYMSPEQCMGKDVDARSDIYSLGCTLYECLTGSPPYAGDHALAVLSKHQLAEIPSLSNTLPEGSYPYGLNGVIARLMAKDPGMRYQSMNALAYDLASISNGDHSPEPLSDTIRRKILSNTFSQKKVAGKAAEVSGWIIFGVAIICCAPVIQGMFTLPGVPSILGRGWTVPPPMVATPEAIYKRVADAWAGYEEVSRKRDIAQTEQRSREVSRINLECTKQLREMGARAIPASVNVLLQEGPGAAAQQEVALRVLDSNGRAAIEPIFKELDKEQKIQARALLCRALERQPVAVRAYILKLLNVKGAEHDRVINIMYNMVGGSEGGSGTCRLLLDQSLQERLALELEHEKSDASIRMKLITLLSATNSVDDFVVDAIGNMLIQDSNAQVRLACAKFFETGSRKFTIAGTAGANQAMRKAMLYDPVTAIRMMGAKYFQGVVLQRLDKIVFDLRTLGSKNKYELGVAARQALCFQALTNEDCMPDLKSALISGNPSLTKYALEIVRLMKRAARPAVPELLTLSNSKDYDFSITAKRLLNDIGPFDATYGPANIKAMLGGSVNNETECQAIKQALRAIKQMTPEQAHQFVPEVKKLLKSEDWRVKELAVQVKYRFQYPDD